MKRDEIFGQNEDKPRLTKQHINMTTAILRITFRALAGKGAEIAKNEADSVWHGKISVM